MSSITFHITSELLSCYLNRQRFGDLLNLSVSQYPNTVSCQSSFENFEGNNLCDVHKDKHSGRS